MESSGNPGAATPLPLDKRLIPTAGYLICNLPPNSRLENKSYRAC